MIVSAGLLAFVVLYNLTIINLSERSREIATIKVLGFFNREVSTYIYREVMLLTAIGALVGLGVGVGLHRAIMASIEQENVMFGNYLSGWSFLIAFGLTARLRPRGERLHVPQADRSADGRVAQVGGIGEPCPSLCCTHSRHPRSCPC